MENGGPVFADESTRRFKPVWKRSMRTHGVRRPVSSTIAIGPSSMHPERYPLQVRTGSGDVLAELSRSHPEARIREGGEELGRDQVNLPEIGRRGWPAGEIAVPDKRAGVGVVFHTMAFQQHDL